MQSLENTFQIEKVIERIISYLKTTNFWISLLVLVIAVILWRVLKKIRSNWKEKNGGFTTTSNVVFDILRFVFIFIVVIVLLQLNGVNVTALITGLGLVSAIVGLALQDFLKDIIMGIHILLDKFFVVGDIVKYNNIEGEVISFNIRTTKLKLLQYREIMTISNRNISEITVLSDMFDLDLDLPYYVDAKKIHTVLTELAQKISGIEGITECIYKGTNSFNDSSITYKIRYFTHPGGKRFDIRREAVMIVQDGLKEAGIPFPYNHLDVEIVNNG